MDKINAVISLNNEAIMLLKSGMEHDSVTLLTQLLVNLKTVLASPTSGGAGSNVTHAPTDGSSMLHAINWMCNEAESLPALAPRCNFVYNKVFKLSRVLEQGSCNEDESSQVFAACIIYNLAVIHHNKGLQAHDSVCMEKAMKLYQMCIRIVANGAFDKFGMVRLLKAIAFNNLAQLHLDFTDFEQAKNCLANLGNILNSADLTSSLSLDEYDGIIANVLLLKPPTVAAAA